MPKIVTIADEMIDWHAWAFYQGLIARWHPERLKNYQGDQTWPIS